MDRQIVYAGSIPLETDILNTNKNVMSALGRFAQDVFGTSTIFTGLACVPNTPAAMNVVVQPGAVYAQAALDTTAYSSLAADSTVTQKQGILKAAQTFATPAPTTSGQSIVYLISASFLEADANAVVLPYYNAANPSQAFSGPSNSGASQNTTRQDTVQLTLTTGVPATTGSQQTPATPAGQIALYTVTVAYGATSVVAGNITKVAPVGSTLTLDLLSQINARALLAGAASQTFDVAAAASGTNAVNRDTGDVRYAFKAGNSTQVFNVANASSSAQALAAGQMQGQLLNVQFFTSSGTYTPTPGTKRAIVICLGAGGGGGGAQGGGGGTLNFGGGGGAGGQSITLWSAPAATTVTIGAGGTGGSGPANGVTGGTTSVVGVGNATGGAGGVYGALITTVSVSSTGGNGGSASAGAQGFVGDSGHPGYAISTVAGFSGRGGSSPYGGGGAQAWLNNTGIINGYSAAGVGGGGSGASGVNNGAYGAGGTGGGGFVMIYEYGGAF